MCAYAVLLLFYLLRDNFARDCGCNNNSKRWPGYYNTSWTARSGRWLSMPSTGMRWFSVALFLAKKQNKPSDHPPISWRGHALAVLVIQSNQTTFFHTRLHCQRVRKQNAPSNPVRVFRIFWITAWINNCWNWRWCFPIEVIVMTIIIINMFYSMPRIKMSQRRAL